MASSWLPQMLSSLLPDEWSINSQCISASRSQWRFMRTSVNNSLLHNTSCTDVTSMNCSPHCVVLKSVFILHLYLYATNHPFLSMFQDSLIAIRIWIGLIERIKNFNKVKVGSFTYSQHGHKCHAKLGLNVF